MKEKYIQNFGAWNENQNLSEAGHSDLFSAEYRGVTIKIAGKFLIQGKERELLQQLKKFNLGSGHEDLKLSQIDNDNFEFRLVTYMGGPTQTIYFERIK